MSEQKPKTKKERDKMLKEYGVDSMQQIFNSCVFSFMHHVIRDDFKNAVDIFAKIGSVILDNPEIIGPGATEALEKDFERWMQEEADEAIKNIPKDAPKQ